MKKILSVLMMIAWMHVGALAQKPCWQNLEGKWEAVDKENEQGSFEIVDSSKIYIIFQGQRKLVSNCTADFTKTPCWFDFTIKDSTQTIKLLGLLQFLNNDTLKWQVFDDDNRPAYFTSDDGDIVYLKRTK